MYTPITHSRCNHLANPFKYVNSSNPAKISVDNPATGDIVSDQIPIAGQDDVDRAVHAAKAAFAPGSEWRSMTAAARQRLLFRFADLLEANQEHLAYLTRLTLGVPYQAFGKGEITMAIGCFRYYAGWVDKFSGQSFPADDGFYKIVRNEPLGVVAGILPWNGPLGVLGLKAAPALAAGNVIIIKPSEKTPFAAAELGKLALDAGFPPGVFQVLPGDGSTGSLLASHMEIAKVSFTGSVPTGKTVQTLAAKSNLKRCTLELGGKSPAVVFDDADLDNAVNWCVNGLTTNSGQVCFASSRVYIQEGIYGKFIAAYQKAFEAKQKVMGDPEAEGTELGPVVDKAQYDRILKIINCAQSEEQGTLLVGGRPVGSKGYYIEPTIFLDPKPDASIYRDEIFGPVAVVNKFKTEKEVLERANDSRYGLMSGVFTENINRALRVSSAFDSGVVGINCISTVHFSCPFGGTKESGLGRELGVNGLLSYTEPKTVLINMNYGGAE